MNKKCTVVGTGFVGATFYEALYGTPGWDFYAYDLNPEQSKLWKDYQDQVNKCVKFEDENPDYCAYPAFEMNWLNSLEEQKDADLYILSVPTPMSLETGECHLGIVEDAIKSVRKVNKDAWIVLKSTVPPGTTQRLNDEYGKVCFSPEFLTEANSFNDFKSLPYQIIGYPECMPGIVDSLDCPLDQLFMAASEKGLILAQQVLSTDCTTAECVKYFRNTYLALRLSFCNEWFDICQKIGIDYDRVRLLAGLDARVGQHYNVVKPERGWSKVCLPKDLNAIIYLQKQLNLKPTMMEAAWNKNLEVRKIRDWEEEGRGIITINNDNDNK